MSTQLMHEKRADEPSPTVFARAFRPTRASLAGWVTALFVVEIAGALIGAATGVTSWHDAFDSKGARLASPWPFLLAQIVLALVACRRSGRVTAVASGVLAITNVISVLATCTDGSFANGIPAGAVVGQILVLTLAAITGGIAALRSVTLWRSTDVYPAFAGRVGHPVR